MPVDFPACPAGCGLAATKLQRPLICERVQCGDGGQCDDGEVVSDALCTSGKPAGTADCSATPACYAWQEKNTCTGDNACLRSDTNVCETLQPKCAERAAVSVASDRVRCESVTATATSTMQAECDLVTKFPVAGVPQVRPRVPYRPRAPRRAAHRASDPRARAACVLRRRARPSRARPASFSRATRPGRPATRASRRPRPGRCAR